MAMEYSCNNVFQSLADMASYNAMRSRLAKMRKHKGKHMSKGAGHETLLEHLHTSKIAFASSRQQYIRCRLKWFAGAESRRLQIESELERTLGSGPDRSFVRQQDHAWIYRFDVSPGAESERYLESEEYRSLWRKAVQIENPAAAPEPLRLEVIEPGRQSAEIIHLPGTRDLQRGLAALARTGTGYELMVLANDSYTADKQSGSGNSGMEKTQAELSLVVRSAPAQPAVEGLS